MIKSYCLLATLVVLLTACGSSQLISRPIGKEKAIPVAFRVETIEDHSGKAVPSPFLTAVKGYLESDLGKRKLLGTENETAARICIDVRSYRMRSGMTRMMLGVLAGKDGLDSEVTVYAAGSDEVLGQSTVSTYNMLAVGGENDIARMHAEEIGRFVAGEKAKH